MPPDRRATRLLRAEIKKRLRKPSSDEAKRKSKPKTLPLVERTNSLSLEDFISLYIPSPELSFRKKSETRVEDSEPVQKVQPKANDTEVIASVDTTQDESMPVKLGPAAEQDLETDSYAISIYTAATIPATQLASCFKLLELTSSDAYKNSSMGWSPSEKRKEMKLPDMKYMILQRGAADGDRDTVGGDASSKSTGQFAGFLEFMVTYEDGYEVLYCYEIHLAPEVQGQGLGEELIERFERIGRRIGLQKAMLTVFKSNSRAIKFYTRIGYAEDENSPRPRKLRNGTAKEADYLIMSKSLRRQLSRS
ncbi:acyl-CoA N-acyltransferase [Aspergillus navahoensis]